MINFPYYRYTNIYHLVIITILFSFICLLFSRLTGAVAAVGYMGDAIIIDSICTFVFITRLLAYEIHSQLDIVLVNGHFSVNPFNTSASTSWTYVAVVRYVADKKARV